jgi:hypothetical protein
MIINLKFQILKKLQQKNLLFSMPLQILMILGQFITLASKLHNCFWIDGPKDLIFNLLHLSDFNQFCYLWTCIVKFVGVGYTLYHILIKCGAISPRYTTKTCNQILSTNANNLFFASLKKPILWIVYQTIFFQFTSLSTIFQIVHKIEI